MIQKRSVTIRGHRTSISLEEEFWDSLNTIAASSGQAVSALIADIDEGRESDTNLSSAVRIFVLNWYRKPKTLLG